MPSTNSAEPRPTNPQAEATSLLPDGLTARVLEPSPPTDTAEPWFADDPIGGAPARGGERVVSPAGGDLSWDAAAEDNPAIGAFAQDHWLGNLKRLTPPPSDLATTRDALRDLAFNVLSPARQAANGKIGLRWTLGGFGTPFFGDDEQIRVESGRLVRQVGGAVESVPITTLCAAADFVGVVAEPPVGIDFHDPPPAADIDAQLPIDVDAAAYLGEWFGFATLALEQLLTIADRPDDTRVQIWTEHFDPAIELGAADTGQRASFGASPGDQAIPVPYLYVSPWTAKSGEFWNAPFGGAALTIEQLIAADDQLATALEFFETGRATLSVTGER